MSNKYCDIQDTCKLLRQIQKQYNAVVKQNRNLQKELITVRRENQELKAELTKATLFALKSYEKLIDKGLSNNEK